MGRIVRMILAGASVCAVAGLAGLPMSAQAQVGRYISGTNGCYDTQSHGYVAASFCSGTIPGVKLKKGIHFLSQTPQLTESDSVPFFNDPGSSSETCAGEGGGVTKREAVGSSWAIDYCSDGTSYSYNTGNVVNAAKPSAKRLSNQDFFIQATTAETRIDASASLLGEQNRIRTNGLLIGTSKDFGDWGYTVLLPLSRSENNGGYGALDRTQFGLSFAPSYHLMKRQVHGFDLDLGGRLAYLYSNFSDVAAVRSATGAYQISDFSNFGTTLLGVNARFAKPLSANTELHLGVAVDEFYNDGAQSLVGKTGSLQAASLGIAHDFSKKLRLSGDVQAQHIRISSGDAAASETYTTGSVGLGYFYNSRTLLNLQLAHTAASGFARTAGMLSANWQLR